MKEIIKNLVTAHNEVIFNIYGDSEPRDLNGLMIGPKDKKQQEEIHLGLTEKFLSDTPKEKVQFIIMTALQQDVLFLKREQEINGELILDNKGLQINYDKNNGILSLHRYYILRDNYNGALSSKIKKVADKFINKELTQ